MWAAAAGDGACRRNIVWAGCKALEGRERRSSSCQPLSLAIRPTAIEHASLEFRVGLDVHVRRVDRFVADPQRDSRDGEPAENMLRSRPSDRNRRGSHGRVQHRSSRMTSRFRTHTQHSSERNIGRLNASQPQLPARDECDSGRPRRRRAHRREQGSHSGEQNGRSA
jgi:hypothetical protein